MIRKTFLAAAVGSLFIAAVAEAGTITLTFANNATPSATPSFTLPSSGCASAYVVAFSSNAEFRMIGLGPGCIPGGGFPTNKNIFTGTGESWSFNDADSNRLTATAGFPTNPGATGGGGLASPSAPVVGSNATVEQNADFFGTPFNFLAPTVGSLAGNAYGPATISASYGATSFTVTFPKLEAQWGGTYFPFANVIFNCSTAAPIAVSASTTFRCFAEHLILSAEDPNAAGFTGWVAQWETVGTLTMPADTTLPTVSTVNPVNGATGVAGNAALTVNFSEPMAAGSVTPVGRFSLKRTSDSLNIPGVTAGSGSAYTFTPGGALVNGTNYTATITTAVTDANGNAMAANYSWSFTAGVVDNTPPTVSGKVPASAATNVATNTTVSVTFNEAMDGATIASAFSMVGSISGAVTVGAPTTADNITFIFTPTTALAAGEDVTVTVSTAAKDVAGNAKAGADSWLFTTASATSSTTLAFPATAGGGGGCAMNSRSAFDPSLVAMLLASLGYLGLRRNLKK